MQRCYKKFPNSRLAALRELKEPNCNLNVEGNVQINVIDVWENIWQAGTVGASVIRFEKFIDF